MSAAVAPSLDPRAEILDACCGGRHWWWDKAHPDLLGDFRAMPFADESFQLVLFDPPHIVREQPSKSYIRLKYGALPPASEQDDLRRGFSECWRVLAPGGSLVFKWGAGSIARVEPHFPAQLIVGTRSPRGGQTRWFIFYKPTLRLEAAWVDAIADVKLIRHGIDQEYAWSMGDETRADIRRALNRIKKMLAEAARSQARPE